MGILSGGIRLRRFQVLGELPPDFRDRYEEAIGQQAFADFGEQDERDQVMGWVSVDDPYDANLYLDRWLVENTINLGLRVDTKRIPAKFLKRECRTLEAEWKLKFGREHLSRAERDEVKEIVTRRLLERVLPATQCHDVSWDLDRGDVLFWGTGEKATELFRSLFEKTFGVKVRLLFPFALALRGEGEDAEARWTAVAPTTFASAGGA
ncbi:MAG: recombination-associated protein RdgC [Deltaproteobacteria bacterium]|nr:recombination-associated protein RdgC [Deltaproteobacteria bacterium]